jgi:RNA polymerase sigma-70 factor (sigma-E family)
MLEQQIGQLRSLVIMGSDSMPAVVMSSVPSRSSRPSRGEPADGGASATAAVTALYQAYALSMVRLAHVILGDRGAAEDVVQDAFSGLYRRWGHLSDHDKAVSYVRTSVLNACRTALRRGKREFSAESPEGGRTRAVHPAGQLSVDDEDERVTVMAALRRLPNRQREVLVLRFYLDMSDQQIADQMGIGASTVRSSAHRALVAVGRMLEESA